MVKFQMAAIAFLLTGLLVGQQPGSDETVNRDKIDKAILEMLNKIKVDESVKLNQKNRERVVDVLNKEKEFLAQQEAVIKSIEGHTKTIKGASLIGRINSPTDDILGKSLEQKTKTTFYGIIDSKTITQSEKDRLKSTISSMITSSIRTIADAFPVVQSINGIIGTFLNYSNSSVETVISGGLTGRVATSTVRTERPFNTADVDRALAELSPMVNFYRKLNESNISFQNKTTIKLEEIRIMQIFFKTEKDALNKLIGRPQGSSYPTIVEIRAYFNNVSLSDSEISSCLNALRTRAFTLISNYGALQMLVESANSLGPDYASDLSQKLGNSGVADYTTDNITRAQVQLKSDLIDWKSSNEMYYMQLSDKYLELSSSLY